MLSAVFQDEGVVLTPNHLLWLLSDIATWRSVFLPWHTTKRVSLFLRYALLHLTEAATKRKENICFFFLLVTQPIPSKLIHLPKRERKMSSVWTLTGRPCGAQIFFLLLVDSESSSWSFCPFFHIQYEILNTKHFQRFLSTPWLSCRFDYMCLKRHFFSVCLFVRFNLLARQAAQSDSIVESHCKSWWELTFFNPLTVMTKENVVNLWTQHSDQGC